MAVRIIRENNRSAGMPVVSGQTIIAGQPLLLAANGETRAYNDATLAAAVYGIAADRTTKPPMSPVSGDPAGSGFDYTNFNRGGLVSAFVNGSELELFAEDDGKPFDDTVTYALNEPLYANASGLITNDDTGAVNNLVGSVVGFDVASSTTRLRVKFTV
jgi:hypothetical protein